MRKKFTFVLMLVGVCLLVGCGEPKCSIEGCKNEIFKNEICKEHYLEKEKQRIEEEKQKEESNAIGTWKCEEIFNEISSGFTFMGDIVEREIELRKSGNGTYNYYNKSRDFQMEKGSLEWEYVDGKINVYFDNNEKYTLIYKEKYSVLTDEEKTYLNYNKQ